MYTANHNPSSVNDLRLGSARNSQTNQIHSTRDQIRSCGHGNCKCCEVFNATAKFKLTRPNTEAKCINPNSEVLSCNSSNVVYMLTCTYCKIQYVGETQQKLSRRISQHRQSIKKKSKFGCPHVVEHFNNGTCNNFTVNVIESCQELSDKKKERSNRLDKEKWWICKARTKFPHGLNDVLIGHDESKPILTNMINNVHNKKIQKE